MNTYLSLTTDASLILVTLITGKMFSNPPAFMSQFCPASVCLSVSSPANWSDLQSCFSLPVLSLYLSFLSSYSVRLDFNIVLPFFMSFHSPYVSTVYIIIIYLSSGIIITVDLSYFPLSLRIFFSYNILITIKYVVLNTFCVSKIPHPVIFVYTCGSEVQRTESLLTA